MWFEGQRALVERADAIAAGVQLAKAGVIYASRADDHDHIENKGFLI